MNKIMVAVTACYMLAACGTQPVTPSAGHIKDEPRPAGNIPKTVQQAAPLSPPKPATKVETYSVVVNKVSVQELLFALARDARVNVDIHPGIEGVITLNAINQTLPQLLTRLAKQVDMRYELDGANLVVMPDTPFLRSYKVDYLNMSRDATSNVSIATQIATAGAGAGAVSGGAGNNNSTTAVTNKSNNRFWDTLVQNIKDILKEEDKLIIKSRSESTEARQESRDDKISARGNGAAGTGVGGSFGGGDQSNQSQRNSNQEGSRNQQVSETERAASVIANPENGLLSVRATGRQHEKIREFIDQIMASAKRQVLIEATVVEVRLSDQYQQGINWSGLHNGRTGFSLTQGGVGTLPSGISPGVSPGIFTLGYVNPNSVIGNITTAIQLLESFGNVKVLSSPKISVLNNQTALLKVVDNKVYFTVGVTITPATTTSAQLIVYTTTVNTVPVGFVMSVTPQIDDADTVTLNVRPTISRITGYVNDPSPPLAAAGVVSPIPEIQTREMESILKVSSGQVAVMGGLMQDSVNNLRDGIPVLSRLPVIGDAFAYRNETTTKSELVIFLRPVVVRDASLDGDYKAYRDFLPNEKPLNGPRGAAANSLFEPARAAVVKP